MMMLASIRRSTASAYRLFVPKKLPQSEQPATADSMLFGAHRHATVSAPPRTDDRFHCEQALGAIRAIEVFCLHHPCAVPDDGPMDLPDSPNCPTCLVPLELVGTLDRPFWECPECGLVCLS